MSDNSITYTRLMDALDEAVGLIYQGNHFEAAVDTVVSGLKNNTSVQIEQYQTVLALSYQTIAKELARERLGERTELDFDEAKSIIYDAAALIAPQVEAVSKARSRDIATNKPLLASGN
jgi:hypothetical protein